MTANLHLFQIEVRRNAGLWLLPILVGLGWFVGRDRNALGMVLWLEASASIGIVSALLGPLIAGVAAWIAGRDRRRRIEELLATTPRPAIARDVAGWAAAAGLGLLAYALVGLYFGGEAVREATWGEPELTPILVGTATVVALAAIGYAAGSFFPSRYTAPLVAIALFVAILIPTTLTPVEVNSPAIPEEGSSPAPTSPSASPMPVPSNSSLQHLSPWWLLNNYGDASVLSVHEELQPDLVVPMVAWLGGLGVGALAAVALRRRRTASAWGTLLAATVLALFGATTLLRAEPKTVAAAAVEPVCTQNVIEVCLHPAYEASLDETAAIVGALMKPLAGIPGAPVRAVGQNPHRPFDPLPEGTVPLFLDTGFDKMTYLASGIAFDLVRYWPHEGEDNAAQDAIAMWLVEQAGFEDEALPFLGVPVEIEAAVDRFAALDPAAQRAWLEANFAALRAGELTLEDLP
jgi:hypothetical protein